MTNEAVLVDRIADPINFGCADIAMEKGTLVKLSGARDVAASTTSGEVFIGITGREKIVGDGRTSVPVFVNGIFRCASLGVVAIGTPVALSGANLIRQAATLDVDTGEIIGRALEAGAGEDNIEVLLGHGGA